ncbi:TPA: hypothetical protein P2I16_001581, partial [Aeromonas salmonicida]|nr:hypothetical protein [Aeromonas salmonicida]
MNDLTPVVLAEVARVKNDLSNLDGDVGAGFSAVLARQHPTEYPWRVFTSSGSFVVPNDGDYYIIAVGGGGGGSGSGGMSGGHGGGGGGGNGGGGGGGVSIRQLAPLLSGATLTITVGAGGSSTSSGGASSVSGSISMSAGGGGGAS